MRGLRYACKSRMISRMWSVSNPLEARTLESAAPLVSVSPARVGSHATGSGTGAGTNLGEGGKGSAKDAAKMASMSIAAIEIPLAGRLE